MTETTAETLPRFINSVISWSIFFPAAAIALFPMTNQLKSSLKKTVVTLIVFLIFFILLIGFLESHFSPDYNFLLAPLLILSFIIYHKSLTVPFYKSLTIFTFSCTVMSLVSNMSNGFDAIINPSSDLYHFSMKAAVFQLVLSICIAIVIAYPVIKCGGYLIDHFFNQKVWFTFFFINAIILSFNLIIAPRKYETLHTNKVMIAFWTAITIFCLLLLLQCIIFYLIIQGIMDYEKTIKRNHMLEIQESRYQVQQRFIEGTARQRHDFKHTLHTLDKMAHDGDIDALREYLDNYIKTMPDNSYVSYTKNTAVNSILNYYADDSTKYNIKLNWNVSFPTSSAISDIDACNIIGNILENAIIACTETEEKRRFIDLTIRYEEDSAIYIACTNSFGRPLKIKNGIYLSTHRNGSGIGLQSIQVSAAGYGGIARFSHEDGEFYSEVMLPLT